MESEVWKRCLASGPQGDGAVVVIKAPQREMAAIKIRGKELGVQGR